MKARVLEGVMACSDTIACSVYDTKPKNFISSAYMHVAKVLDLRIPAKWVSEQANSKVAKPN